MKNVCYKGAPLGIMNIYATFSENKKYLSMGQTGKFDQHFLFFFYKKLKHVSYQKENQSQYITFLHQKYTEMHGLT